MSIELILPPEWDGRNKVTGRYLKGHVPDNKGKKWDEYMSKRGQRRARKGWKNLDIHRNKNGRSDVAGRCKKEVIAVLDDGSWKWFSFLGAAAQWLGGSRHNIGRCCRMNESRAVLHDPKGRPTAKVNTDYRYMGVRWYFESDNVWTSKVKQ